MDLIRNLEIGTTAIHIFTSTQRGEAGAEIDLGDGEDFNDVCKAELRRHSLGRLKLKDHYGYALQDFLYEMGDMQALRELTYTSYAPIASVYCVTNIYRPVTSLTTLCIDPGLWTAQSIFPGYCTFPNVTHLTWATDGSRISSQSRQTSYEDAGLFRFIEKCLPALRHLSTDRVCPNKHTKNLQLLLPRIETLTLAFGAVPPTESTSADWICMLLTRGGSFKRLRLEKLTTTLVPLCMSAVDHIRKHHPELGVELELDPNSAQYDT